MAARQQQESKQLTLNAKAVQMSSPKALADFAKTLKEFVVSERLYVDIKGKNYVMVEAWQFAGASMGVFPIVKAVERVMTDDPKEYKYKAHVELKRVDNDQIVGAGFAYCSNIEIKKKTFDEYAVASMAQTRATAKAYRNAFGWLMKMAGYEATPAEEMKEASDSSAATVVGEEKVEKAKSDIKAAKDFSEIADALNELTAEEKLLVQNDANERLRELTDEEESPSE